MKTQIQKIFAIAAIMIFLGTGVSLADDGNDRYHNSHGNAYGRYKAKNHPHPSWHAKHPKFRNYYREKYVYKEVREYHYYENDYHRREASESVIFKIAVADPNVAFKIVLKESR